MMSRMRVAIIGGGVMGARTAWAVAMQQRIGIETRLVGADEMRELVPGIAVDDRAIGAYEPRAGFCDPLLAVHAFADLARECGAELRIGVEARRVVVEEERVRGVE